jgi:hypothetical protein
MNIAWGRSFAIRAEPRGAIRGKFPESKFHHVTGIVALDKLLSVRNLKQAVMLVTHKAGWPFENCSDPGRATRPRVAIRKQAAGVHGLLVGKYNNRPGG